jgi:hypothetical protein
MSLSTHFQRGDDHAVNIALDHLDNCSNFLHWISRFGDHQGFGRWSLLGETIRLVPTERPEFTYEGPFMGRCCWEVGDKVVQEPIDKYIQKWLMERMLDSGLVLEP